MLKINKLFLHLLAISLPFWGFSLVNIGNIGIRFDWLFGGALIIVFFLRICTQPRTILVNNVGKAVLILHIVAFLSLVNYYKRGFSLYDFFTVEVQAAFSLFLFFAITNLKIEWRGLRRVLKTVILTGCVISGYGIYQFAARNLNLPFANLPMTNASFAAMRAGSVGPWLRASSVFGEPSWFGSFIIPPIIILGISLLYKNDSRPYFSRGKSWFLLSILLFGLLFSFSLGAYATFLGVFGIARIQKKGIKKLRLIKLAAIGLVILLSISLIIQVVAGGPSLVRVVYLKIEGGIFQLFNITESPKIGSSANIRLAANLVGLKIWIHNPFIGVGLNQLQHLAPIYLPPQYKGKRIVGTTTIITQILSNQGILGFGCYVFFLASLVKTIRKWIKKTQGESQAVLIALYFVTWADIISGFFAFTWFTILKWFYYSLVCLTIFTIASSNNRKEQRLKA